MRISPLLAVTVCLAACASPRQTPSAGVAIAVDPAALQSDSSQISDAGYQIGPSDKLALTVFRVSDLTFPEIYVDAAGNLQLPLLGSIRAAGLTPAQLSEDIERRLGQRYLRNPQVMVTVSEAASQKITVDGAVAKPGVYEMSGRTTLMQAVAMAEGPTRVAELDSVAVFRTVEGRRMVAVFDLNAIRGGQAADPLMLNSVLRDVIQALPGLGVFAYL
jgi:polysaccharide biosynthesis/export protein